jgi:flavin reductase (DIM6/NTAB) family NADH-FMN oxidoreductase RutF
VALECTLWKIVPVGHHAMVLGEVQAMHIADAAVTDAEKCYIDTPSLGLVGRMHGRGWYARTTDRLEVPRITPEQWAAQKTALSE